MVNLYIILFLSLNLLLISASTFNATTNLSFENNSSFTSNHNMQFVYAQDGGDGGDGGGDGDGGDGGGDTPDFFGSNNANGDGNGGDDDGGNTPNDGSNTANFFSSPSEGSNDETTDSTPDQQGETPPAPPTQGTPPAPPTEGTPPAPPTEGTPPTPPSGETPPQQTPPPTGPPNNFQQKITYEFNYNVIDRTTNKIIVKYDNNIEKQIIVITDKINCPTQSDSVELSGKISPKGIRLLADFDPCRIVDGGVTLNMPNNPNLKLAAVYIDKNGNNHAGTLVNPVKIQNINKNQGLYTIELDDTMKGINPVTGQTTTLTKINGLALYNNGDKPIQFKSGNIAALTAVFTK